MAANWSNRPLILRRDFGSTHLNSIVNDPDVRPWVGGGSDALDLTQLVANPRNVLLSTDNGALLFLELEPGQFEVHTQFRRQGRGAESLRGTEDALFWMFTRTECVDIVTKVPVGNARAAALVRHVGARQRFRREKAWHDSSGASDLEFYGLSIEDWVSRTSRLELAGHWFHDKLEAAKAATVGAAPLHPDDPAHDRYVGATVAMIQGGQLSKAIAYYNRWARFAGYGPIHAIAQNPDVIDIGDALLAIRDQDFDVILCRH